MPVRATSVSSERIGASAADKPYGLGGSFRIFLADILMVPTGILTVAFLTRRLGPSEFGLFTMAATVIAWVEWSIVSLFSRATVRLVGESRDWQPAGTTVLRLHLAVAGTAMAALWALAPSIAALLHEPALAGLLRLFAIEIPLFGITYAHRDILVGTGRYNERARMSAARWIARLVLVIALVGAGFSITGAILASMGALLVELIVARRYVQPTLFGHSNLPVRRVLLVAMPLVLFGLCMRMFDRVDLLVLKALGSTAADAGVYAAAQSLTLLPGLFALSFSPVLLSTLTRALRAGDDAVARSLGLDALRIGLRFLPFGGLIAGSAAEIVAFIFGPLYTPAEGVLSVLTFGALSLVIVSISTAVLTAIGRARSAAVLAAGLLVTATAGHLLVIPRFGAIGAAIVTTTVAAAGAFTALMVVYSAWSVAPALANLLRSVAVTGGMFALATFWPAPGLLLFVKLPVLALLSVTALHLLGDFSGPEIASARAVALRVLTRRESRTRA
ncbi:MAG: oligosaccharide flippase family protein [Anaerolineae bacterium]|nr:oligosaccharide flippase family protein [Gemmatimonadaceae bacterium]